MATPTFEVKILRQPDPHSGSHWETFEVPYEEGMNVTTVLLRIAAHPLTVDHQHTFQNSRSVSRERNISLASRFG